MVIALPRELPENQYEELIREYCQEQFISKGMIADYAIHDKGDGNPHAHIMLTLRAMDENGNWLPKSHKVYMLDENGERIRLPSGQWKSYKVKTTDWDSRKNAEIWRSAWADTVNQYYERNDCSERIDLRSYQRQGKELIPTIHLGPAVAHMEQKGVRTEIGNYNREITAHNRKVIELNEQISEVGEQITSATEKLDAIQKSAKRERSLYDYVTDFITMRRQGKTDWSADFQQNRLHHDKTFMADALRWMNEHHVETVKAYQDFLASKKESMERLSAINSEVKQTEASLKYLQIYEKLHPVYEQSKRGFTRAKERYAETHKEELAAYNKSVRYLKANKLRPNDVNRLKARRKKLLEEQEYIAADLKQNTINDDLINRIAYCVRTVQEEEHNNLHETTPDKQKTKRRVQSLNDER